MQNEFRNSDQLGLKGAAAGRQETCAFSQFFGPKVTHVGKRITNTIRLIYGVGKLAS